MPAGTEKVRQAQDSGQLHVVNPDWLWSCLERWDKVEERLFPLRDPAKSQRWAPAGGSEGGSALEPTQPLLPLGRRRRPRRTDCHRVPLTSVTWRRSGSASPKTQVSFKQRILVCGCFFHSWDVVPSSHRVFTESSVEGGGGQDEGWVQRARGQSQAARTAHRLHQIRCCVQR